jgi:hypothetical protein
MEVTSVKPGSELASLTASALQNTRFKERKLREASSDVQNDVVYFSPVIRIDKDTNVAILQYRDSTTGKVENEYPSKRQIESYQHTEALVSSGGTPPVKEEDESV